MYKHTIGIWVVKKMQMLNDNKFIPCKECVECGLDLYEGEPYYYCTLNKGVMYFTIKEMIKHCPLRT